ncbi:MAG: response regulator [Deltaproteobacteria bacterium]|nr:response regulator [Deltaproteobacteria bacterium]
MVYALKKKTMIVLSKQSEGLRMKEAFEEIGIESCAVNSGLAAKELASREFFDIIICDAVLPDITGRELIEEMMFISPESRVVLIEKPNDDTSAIEDLIESDLFKNLFSQGSSLRKVYPSN